MPSHRVIDRYPVVKYLLAYRDKSVASLKTVYTTGKKISEISEIFFISFKVKNKISPSTKLQYYRSLTFKLFSVSYLGHLLEASYPSAKKQSVYSAAVADWAIF